MASQIAEVRSKPFVILAIMDAQRESLLSESKLNEITKTLEDMSLQFAQTYLSTVYVDELESACENVLGVVNLGLMSESNKDLDKAKVLLVQRNIMDFFRIGWSKIQELEQIQPECSSEVIFKKFSLGVNSTFDNYALLQNLTKNFNESNLLEELNKKLLLQHYPKYFRSGDKRQVKNATSELSAYVCTIIIKAFIGTLSESQGALNEKELLDYIDRVKKYSYKELIRKISSDQNVLDLVKGFSIDLKKIFQAQLDNFLLEHSDFPLYELYNIVHAKKNKHYSTKQIACIISEQPGLDIDSQAIINIAFQLSKKQWNQLNLGDRDLLSL